MDKVKFIDNYVIFLLIVSISFVVVIMFYKYQVYLNYYGKVIDGNLLVYIKEDDISKISNKLKIDNEEKQCVITNISNKIIDTNGFIYYEVYYKCDLNEITNYIFNIKIYSKETTILNNLKKGLH